MTNKKPIKILHLTIRVPKEESAFTYFQLESNEGLCFYSTLESSLKQSYRDIDIVASLDFEKEVRHLISTLEKEYPIQTLIDEIMDDCQDVGRISGK